MFSMILKMSGITALYVLLVAIVWYKTKDNKLTLGNKIFIGVIFGISSILSTHFGVPYESMVINVRDLGPLSAGLFFSPLSGIIAGLMGGIERYIVGTYFGIGAYTRIACSLSTCLAGFVALAMNVKVFKGKKPSPFYAFFMGAVMEVFHMYVVFITHRGDMSMAFMVVSICAVPMIVFTGIGMASSSICLQVFTGEWVNPFRKMDEESISVSQRFQRWLFVITSIVIIGNFGFTYMLQTSSAYQKCEDVLSNNLDRVRMAYLMNQGDAQCDRNVGYVVYDKDGRIKRGINRGFKLSQGELDKLMQVNNAAYEGSVLGRDVMVYTGDVNDQVRAAAFMELNDVYWSRDAEAYELALGDILLFTVIYVLIAYLVNQIVVNNIRLINDSLGKITKGNLNEVVDVRSSSEFASLSDDINQTVVALKGYIAAAEKRIEQELSLAKSIQESALPKNFDFPDRDEFKLFASMKTAKEVGGDFYDFFFVDRDKMALVMADVSGKGIPAALFMMRSKTALRSFAEAGGSPKEIMEKANETLCEGNDAEMFVTAWIGIIDLRTGLMKCANAGHEYPAIKKKNGVYELLKDAHSLPLAAMEGVKAKEYEIQLQPGDRIYLYTDGVTEAMDLEGVQFGTDNMVDALNKMEEPTVEETLYGMARELESHKGDAEQSDDITMMCFELQRTGTHNGLTASR